MSAQPSHQAQPGPSRPPPEQQAPLESSTGPLRTQKQTMEEKEAQKKGPIAAPVKSACTFCRSRKSRCDGNKPCAACVARGRTDDCIYTISRRGGKPKPKDPAKVKGGKDQLIRHGFLLVESSPAELQNHLDRLFALSELPLTVRKPGAIPTLGSYPSDFQPQVPGSDTQRLFAQLQAQHNSNLAANGWSAASDQTNFFNQFSNKPFPFDAPGTNPPHQVPPAPNSVGISAPSQQQQQHQQHQGSWGAQSMGPDIRTILADYYKYLYRFIPVLPSPIHIDTIARTWDSRSPFILALQCVLPMLKGDDSPEVVTGGGQGLGGAPNAYGSSERKRKIKEVTCAIERKASEAIDEMLEKAEAQSSGEAILEVIQALCVLVIYEYGNGRALKARLKADQALGLAMAQGLHKLSSPGPFSPGIMSPPSSFVSSSNSTPHSLSNFGIPPNDIFEMKKKCWWTVWTLVLWAAYNTGRIPTIRADDPRVRCELPAAADPEAWANNVKSLQTLLLVQDRVLALANLGHQEAGDRSKGSSPPVAPYSPSQRVATTSGRFNSQSPLSIAGSNFPSSASAHGSVNEDSEIPTSFSSLPSMASRQEILDSMLDIDAYLQDQIAQLESKGSRSGSKNEERGSDPLEHVEDELVENLRNAAAAQIYSSSLTLHIGQAFQGASLFERKLCFLNSISDNSDPSVPAAVCREPMPNAFYDEFADVASHEATQHGLAQSWNDPNTTSGAAGAAQAWNNGQQLGASGGGGGGPMLGQPVQQDLYARGPFLPRLSLQRCVHASKSLLDLSKARKDRRINPNPFNTCAFVLISFVLLMQALAVHGGYAGQAEEGEAEEEEEEEEEGGDSEGHEGSAEVVNNWPEASVTTTSLDDRGGSAAMLELKNQCGLGSEVRPQDLMTSAMESFAIGPPYNMGMIDEIMDIDWNIDGSPAMHKPTSNLDAHQGHPLLQQHHHHLTQEEQHKPSAKQIQLREIWNRVRIARDTLVNLSKHWDMAEPMAEEVNLCLETSQLLLGSS
ncbi:hypothetical protein IE53DRAFT_370368 [Violaceomyces palustris]|uniref:Uncharacterized protein n=1 Tax=Violaceomyces palustris TaxID=1673888 RepID=A0ACD0NSA0_9BASI|nr:hypothetical protein IE53DRAFT_370368 [Violaceomyces palustris]